MTLPSGRPGNIRRCLGGALFAALTAAACAPATQPTSASPAAAPPKSRFAQSLSLAMSFGNVPAAGDTSVKANFALTNNGSATFEGCFGPSWGVSVLVGGHDAGHLVRVEHPNCVEKLTLLPRQKIVWSKTVPLNRLPAGMAKITGWVKVIDPATCDRRTGCRETSIATALMSMAIGER
jgi:hypothetical protein